LADVTTHSYSLVQRILELAFEKKAYSPRVFDVSKLCGYTDWIVVLSGRSDRQVRAIADHVAATLKAEAGLRAVGIEGEDVGQWVLIDYADVVVHVFNAPVRDYYDLDALFHDAPRMNVPEPAWEAEMAGAFYEQAPYIP
jgi:ribosome-associated protein